MLEMVVFAITLVVSNVTATLIIMKVFMSKRFIKKYVQMTKDMMVLGFEDSEE